MEMKPEKVGWRQALQNLYSLKDSRDQTPFDTQTVLVPRFPILGFASRLVAETAMNTHNGDESRLEVREEVNAAAGDTRCPRVRDASDVVRVTNYSPQSWMRTRISH